MNQLEARAVWEELEALAHSEGFSLAFINGDLGGGVTALEIPIGGYANALMTLEGVSYFADGWENDEDGNNPALNFDTALDIAQEALRGLEWLEQVQENPKAMVTALKRQTMVIGVSYEEWTNTFFIRTTKGEFAFGDINGFYAWHDEDALTCGETSEITRDAIAKAFGLWLENLGGN